MTYKIKNIKNINIKNITHINNIIVILLLLTLVFLLILIYGKLLRYKTYDKEGLAVIDDIKDAVKQVSKIGDIAEKIPKEISSIKNEIKDSTNVVKDSVNQIDGKLEDFLDEVKKTTVDIVTEKITNVLKQISDIFQKGLIKPILVLFTGIGNIFVGIFGILREIGNKIISLPGCMLTYLVTGVYDTFYSVYKFIIPQFLRNILSKIYGATLKYVVDWFLSAIGYTESARKCYAFNVNSSIDTIEDSAKKIGDTFSSDFGRLDFSKIKV